jgi:hypothetical protein
VADTDSINGPSIAGTSASLPISQSMDSSKFFLSLQSRDWHWTLDREGVAWPGGPFPLYCLAEGQGCAAGLAAGMSRNMNGGPLHGGLQSAHTCMLRRAAGREMKLEVVDAGRLICVQSDDERC